VHAVCISDPTETLTKFAVRVGLAEEGEEAGNRRVRLTINQIHCVLAEAGFRTVYAERYAMLYRHEADLPIGLCSLPIAFPTSVPGWGAVE